MSAHGGPARRILTGCLVCSRCQSPLVADTWTHWETRPVISWEGGRGSFRQERYQVRRARYVCPSCRGIAILAMETEAIVAAAVAHRRGVAMPSRSDQARAAIAEEVTRVDVLPARKGQDTYDPARLRVTWADDGTSRTGGPLRRRMPGAAASAWAIYGAALAAPDSPAMRDALADASARNDAAPGGPSAAVTPSIRIASRSPAVSDCDFGAAATGNIDYPQAMPRDTEQLASRFRRAMLYVVEQLGEVGVTKLEKILYLADLEYFHETGATITGARWVRYTHGPMAKAVKPSTPMMDGHELTVTKEPAGPYESSVYRLGPSPRFAPELASEEREVLDRVIALTRDLGTGAVKDLAYNTAPMRHIIQREARVGHELIDADMLFDLDPQTVAAAATVTPEKDPGARLLFKQRELARIAPLRAAGLAAAAPPE